MLVAWIIIQRVACPQVPVTSSLALASTPKIITIYLATLSHAKMGFFTMNLAARIT
jgi:hypothetical protein